jgi:hypothetical protein
MAEAPGFAFQSASAPNGLMDELEKFITFWLGPRKKKFGVPESALKKLQIPGPLRRLYAFAGRWKRPHPDVNEDTEIFSIQDHLRTPEQLKHTPDGKLIFLNENQGNWRCATLPEGDDPPVWVENVFGTYGQGEWGLVTNSLSRFLVTFCLQELLFGSRICLHDKNLLRHFESANDEAVPLWVGGPYAHDRDLSFHLLHGCVLVGPGSGLRCFAANHDSGLRFLTAHQGEIREVDLGLHASWSLSILPDGSAKLTLPNWSDSSARTPAGTFDFAAVRDRLLADCSETGAGNAEWYAAFPRSGQSSCRGMAVTNARLARTLFRRAIKAVTTREAKFDELLRRFPPPI